MAKVLHEENFTQSIAEGTALVEFYSDGCVPCRRMSPLLAELEEESDVTVYKVNIAVSRSLVADYEVQSTPTLILFRDGKEIARNHGYLNKGKLLEFLKEAGALA